MATSHLHDQSRFAELTFDSTEHGWGALVLRQLTYVPVCEDAFIPPVSDQTITMAMSGDSDVASGIDGRWTWARGRPGSVSMTAPGRSAHLRWRARSAEPLRSLALYIPDVHTNRLIEELWDRDPGQIGMPDTLAVADPILEHTIRGLVRAAEDGFPNTYAEAAVDFLIVHILLRYANVPRIPPLGAEDARIREAKRFLRENLDRPVSLAEVAEEVALSRYHFQRTFRLQTGETPNHFQNRLRIERACVALATGLASVTEIASRCGFTNPAYFSSVFRQATGHTPSGYRRRHRS